MGQTRVVIERRSLQRLQLDTVPEPLRFEDVTVLEYANNARTIESNVSTPEQADFAQHYQQYTGARVKVIQAMKSREYAVVEGRVMRVVVLGDWYITDNPDMQVAFTRDKFDIVKFHPASVKIIEDPIDED